MARVRLGKNITIGGKLGFKGERLLQIALEFECCRTIAKRAGATLREVQTATLGAAGTDCIRKSGA